MTVGERVFSVVRGRLYERLPALALPLGKLSCREADVTAAGTDGRAALFAPGFLEREFLAGSELPERLTLHLLLHLMLGHPRSRRGRDKVLWDTACDLAVLLVRHALLPQEREAPDAFSARCKLQVKKAGRAEEIYALLQAEPELLTPDERLSAVLDEHFRWETVRAADRPAASGEGDETGFQALGRLLPQPLPEKPVIGSGTGGAVFSIKPDTRESAPFAAVLRELSETRENRHVSGEEFQYAWYLYGLEHYGGMPLIEPLEYSEERRLRELAVVIDTSASCSRSLCAGFLGELAGLLGRENLFFERFNLHVIECDCEVQQDTRLTTLAELSDWLRTMTLHGGGGTDFRPAFRYIDGLIESGEFAHLQGILYFTDGYGVFPDAPPAYRVIFAMLQYRYDDIDLPPWAEKLVLEADKPKGKAGAAADHPRLYGQNGGRRVAHTARKAAACPAHGPAGHRQNGDFVTACAGGARRPRLLHHDAPHAPERARPAGHRRPHSGRAAVPRDGIYHERDHCLGLCADGENQASDGDFVSRRDQLCL